MTQDDKEICGCAAMCPVCGADVICCDEDPKHSGSTLVKRVTSGPDAKKSTGSSVFKEGPKRKLGPN